MIEERKKIIPDFGKVLDTTVDAFNEGFQMIIHKGGTGSGKTYDIMLFLIFVYAIFHKNRIITVVSESLPHLKIGAIRYTDEILKNYGYYDQIKYNQSDHIITFPNGTILEFYSTDRIGKAIGARRDVLFGNEINNIKKDIWDEMARRSRLIIADFNPTSKFWLEEWLQYYDSHIVINSNYLDNPYLPEFEKKRISQRAAVDENFRRVHINNEYGIAEGLIFTDWEQVDWFPENCKWEIYGLDFGFSNHVSAIIKVGYYDQALWYDEILYRTGMNNHEIAEFAKQNIDGKIIADSAEPKSIEEIKSHGINIEGVEKPKGSVNYGIDLMKQYPMYVTKRSVNFIRELRNYKWKTDKDGNPTNEPLKINDDGCDAARYGIFYELAVSEEEGIIEYDDRVNISNI